MTNPRMATRTKAFSGPSRLRSVVTDLIIDLMAPVVLTAVTAHELLYNDSPLTIWLLTTVLIWALVLRRRMPMIVFVVCLGVVLYLCALGVDSLAYLAALVALYSVAAHRTFRYALACTLLLGASVLFIAERVAPKGSVDDAVVLLAGLAAAALFLGTTLRGNRGYLASVEDRAERLEFERAQQAQLAALEERARIAREMHDIVAHGLSVVITLAEGAAATVETDPARAHDTMRQVASSGRQSLAEMRKLLTVLRAEDDADRSPQPTMDSLDALVDDIQRTGLVVEVDIAGDPAKASDAVQATIYRIVQESLTNVIKHAASPSRVTVGLEFSDTATFSIEDDGRPVPHLDPAQTDGNGLKGIQERVAIFDGTVDAGPTAAGWQVSGELRLI